MQLQVEYVDISTIKPYKGNAKEHPKEQIEQIKKSMQEFGNIDPIGIWHNEIVEGHGRYLALKELGETQVPVIRLDDLTDEQRRAYTLVHNQLTMNSGFDLDTLKVELDNIGEIDMSEFGFSLDGIGEEPQEVQEDDFDEEPPEEPTSQLGDIYQLGEHRLMCGDSTNAEHVAKLMDGAKADMVFTDPPYGMKKENDGVLNDNLNYDDLLDFNKKWIPLSFDCLKSNGSWYCWGIDEPLMDIYANILKPMIKDSAITFRNLITWDKGNGQGQLSEDFRMYPIADEKCLFVMSGVQGFNNNADNYFAGWEPIRKYLYDERIKCGWDVPMMKTIAGHSDKFRDHWTSKSQWNLPTEQTYKLFQQWANDNNVDAFKREYEDIKREYEDIKKAWYDTRAYFDNTHENMNNVWHFDRANVKERKLTGGHATPKPLALCARAIKSSSREGETALDLFGGSGSTLIACEQLNRKCYMMEMSPKYVDVIIKRWEEYTGKKAVKIA